MFWAGVMNDFIFPSFFPSQNLKNATQAGGSQHNMIYFLYKHWISYPALFYFPWI